MNTDNGADEHVIYQTRFQGRVLDFRGRPVFLRYDCCEFVKCQILLDEGTTSVAFTYCTFEDCNIDAIQADEHRGVVARDNIFKPPIEDRRLNLERRLALALAARDVSRGRRFP